MEYVIPNEVRNYQIRYAIEFSLQVLHRIMIAMVKKQKCCLHSVRLFRRM